MVEQAAAATQNIFVIQALLKKKSPRNPFRNDLFFLRGILRQRIAVDVFSIHWNKNIPSAVAIGASFKDRIGFCRIPNFNSISPQDNSRRSFTHIAIVDTYFRTPIYHLNRDDVFIDQPRAHSGHRCISTFFSSFGGALRGNSSLSHLTPLESGYASINPSAENCRESKVLGSAILAVCLLLISAIFLKYGLWNIYDGPQTLLGPLSLVAGWFPFVFGVWLLIYRVFGP